MLHLVRYQVTAVDAGSRWIEADNVVEQMLVQRFCKFLKPTHLILPFPIDVLSESDADLPIATPVRLAAGTHFGSLTLHSILVAMSAVQSKVKSLLVRAAEQLSQESRTRYRSTKGERLIRVCTSYTVPSS
jgi:hypothetical protein